MNMKEENKINQIKQEVNLISVIPLEFKDDNGNQICGYKYHYYINCPESERDKIYGKKYGTAFIAKEKLEDKELYKNKVYPCLATLVFELVDMNKKPKVVKVII